MTTKTGNLLAAIPDELTRFTQLPNEQGHNAVWDFVRSPDGRFFVSVCGENEKPLTAYLYEYYPDTGGLRLIVDVAKAWIVDPQQMPPSKIHTSIDFLPDGRLIMATHNTAPAPGHKQWMLEQFYEHTWEGYPGSIVMIVDPDTNEVNVRGIPVPRESIYGGMLGNDPRYYYFLGYMRGHLYRLDLMTNEVKDYGKVSEYSSCRLVKDRYGRFYGSSYTGGLWMFDPATEEVTDLKVWFESPHGTAHRRQFIFAVTSPKGTIFMVDNVDGEMLELDPETLTVTRHGPIHLPEQVPKEPYGIGGLAADANFVLYYGLKTNDGYMPIRLVRWDILNGGKPENLGLIAPLGKDSQYICEMIFDNRGRLHMVDVCGQFSPYILTVDVGRLEPPGPDAPSAELHPYWEPDYNGVGAPAYMHIRAETTRVLPLPRHLDWKDTAVVHMRADVGKLYSIGGRNRVLLVESEPDRHEPSRITTLYDGAGPLSCADADDRIAVLTADGRLFTVDAASARVEAQRKAGPLVRLHGLLGDGTLLASDAEGLLYAVDWRGSGGVGAVRGEADGEPRDAGRRPEGVRQPVEVGYPEGGRQPEGVRQPEGGGYPEGIRRLEGVRLNAEVPYVLILDGRRLLLSGDNDELVVYDAATATREGLPVRAPSIRGRSFRAALSGGAVLADGTVVAGTVDGLLFTLSPDLARRTVYGRLYSTGELRGFVRAGERRVFGIYGGQRDAGHVFAFTPEDGFTDLGRPRVTKDNPELSGTDTEWASIHVISCLAFSPADDWLSVASGELYACIVRYRGVQFPA